MFSRQGLKETRRTNHTTRPSRLGLVTLRVIWVVDERAERPNKLDSASSPLCSPALPGRLTALQHTRRFGATSRGLYVGHGPGEAYGTPWPDASVVRSRQGPGRAARTPLPVRQRRHAVPLPRPGQNYRDSRAVVILVLVSRRSRRQTVHVLGPAQVRSQCLVGDGPVAVTPRQLCSIQTVGESSWKC